jgi:hypothetical protein
MMQKISALVIFGILSFLSCAGSPPETESPSGESKTPPAESSGFWNTGFSGEELVFYGIAGVYSNWEDSIRSALEDAAKKVAIFTQVEGTVSSFTHTGGGVFDYKSGVETALIYDEDYKKYRDALSFDPETDVLEYNNTVFVRVRYKASPPAPFPNWPSSFLQTSKPAWIDRPPDIPGYTTGVGYAGRRSLHRETIAISYENAVFSIITALYTSSVTEESGYLQGSGAFDISSVNNHEISVGGILYYFYVMDMWVDPSNKSVWTLGAAKKPD